MHDPKQKNRLLQSVLFEYLTFYIANGYRNNNDLFNNADIESLSIVLINNVFIVLYQSQLTYKS
jgi:hypothetical protein